MKTYLSDQVTVHQATIILMKVEELLENKKTLPLKVDYYENGREQGFWIVNTETEKAVSFAEVRNSDEVAVYFGNQAEFSSEDNYQNIPSDYLYGMRKTFSGSNSGRNAAAQFIVKFLK
jgi:hypothetical protein